MGLNCEIQAYILNNREKFREKLLSEAENVASKIHEILKKGNIDLLKNAEKIAVYVVTDNKRELISFAKIEGIAWASNDLTLAFKLEWIHALRRTLWYFIRQFFNEENKMTFDFYEMEELINDGIDEFLNTFFLVYSKYKDDLILSQRSLVEHLSVPIIPVSPTIAVLPLIGESDAYRMEIVEEKVLNEISRIGIQTLIIDLSGMSEMDEVTLASFEKVLIGINMMGAQPILTGLRPDLVRKMVRIGVCINKHTDTKGTLQQTLNQLMV